LPVLTCCVKARYSALNAFKRNAPQRAAIEEIDLIIQVQ